MTNTLRHKTRKALRSLDQAFTNGLVKTASVVDAGVDKLTYATCRTLDYLQNPFGIQLVDDQGNKQTMYSGHEAANTPEVVSELGEGPGIITSLSRGRAGLGALLLTLWGSPVLAADEPPKKPENSLFLGTIQSGSGETTEFDSMFNYKNVNGAQAIAETLNTPWAETRNDIYRIGARTPFIAKKFRLSASGEIQNVRGTDAINPWSYQISAEALPLDQLVIRAAGFQNSNDIVGGSVGGKFTHKNFTLGSDAWYDGTNFHGRGFLAGVIPTGNAGDLYVSLGGKEKAQIANLVAGLINPEGFSFYATACANFEQGSQSGKVILIPRGFTYGRGSLDFRSHYFNGTELFGEVTPNLMDGWAPFDAHAVDGVAGHWSIVGAMSNSQDSIGGNAAVFYRVNPGLFAGTRVGDRVNKATGVHDPNLDFELYVVIPKTPVDAWLQSSTNLRTGDTGLSAYVGVSHEF